MSVVQAVSCGCRLFRRRVGNRLLGDAVIYARKHETTGATGAYPFVEARNDWNTTSIWGQGRGRNNRLKSFLSHRHSRTGICTTRTPFDTCRQPQNKRSFPFEVPSDSSYGRGRRRNRQQTIFGPRVHLLSYFKQKKKVTTRQAVCTSQRRRTHYRINRPTRPRSQRVLCLTTHCRSQP